MLLVTFHGGKGGVKNICAFSTKDGKRETVAALSVPYGMQLDELRAMAVWGGNLYVVNGSKDTSNVLVFKGPPRSGPQFDYLHTVIGAGQSIVHPFGMAFDSSKLPANCYVSNQDSNVVAQVRLENCPIQDDPERRIGFQYKMILKTSGTGGKMRVHGDTGGERRGAEPGPDAGRVRGKRVDALCRRVQEGALCVGTGRVGAGGICATGPAGTGGGAGLSVQDDRQVDAADRATDPAVPADGGGAGRSLSAAALCAGVHGGGRAATGAGGPGARAAERTGYAVHSGAGIPRLRADGICAAGQDFGSTSLQSAKETGLSESGGLSREHPRGAGGHWGAAPARSARAPRIFAGGYGASGGLGGPQGSVPSQLRGRGHAMGSGGVCAENQRGVSDTRIYRDAGAVPVPDLGPAF